MMVMLTTRGQGKGKGSRVDVRAPRQETLRDLIVLGHEAGECASQQPAWS